MDTTTATSLAVGLQAITEALTELARDLPADRKAKVEDNANRLRRTKATIADYADRQRA